MKTNKTHIVLSYFSIYAVALLACVVGARVLLLKIENSLRARKLIRESDIYITTENPLDILLNKEPAEKPETVPVEFSSADELFAFLKEEDGLFARALMEILESGYGGIAFDRANDWSPYAAEHPSKAQDIQRIENIFTAVNVVSKRSVLLLQCSGFIEIINLQIKVKKAKAKWKQISRTV